MNPTAPLETPPGGPGAASDLRRRAAARLNGDRADPSPFSPADALRVLFDLASRPDTVPQALSLLHELQVYQVELELQAEELRGARLALERQLGAQTSRYEQAPVGCYIVDRHLTLQDLNLTGARMLGGAREALIGQRLSAFVAPSSLTRLSALLGAAGEPGEAPGCTLELRSPGLPARSVHAVACNDTASTHWHLAFGAAPGPRDD